MPTYETDGFLTTSKQSEDDGDDLTWDTQAEWNAYQAIDDVEVPGNYFRLQDITIPSSVVIQHTATGWAQGDSTVADDDGGTNPMSLTGDLQATTLSDGSESITADGSNDYGQFTMPSAIEGSDLNAFAVEYAIGSFPTTETTLFGQRNDDQNQNVELFLNRNENNNTETGNFRFVVTDDSGDSVLVAPTNNPQLDDGNRHDISVSIDDAANNNATIFIDGSEVSATVGVGQSPSNFTTWDNDMHVFARYQGGVEKYTAIDVGAARWHNTSITSQTINNYPFN